MDIQFRVSEVLVLLCFWRPDFIIGVTVGTYFVIGSARTLEAFILAVFYQFLIMWVRKSATVKQMMETAVLGIKAVLAAICILAMAYCMNSITKGLGAANYLINLTQSWMTPFWLLTITFIICALISFLTGSSWGTYAIMLPITLPLAFGISGGEMAPVVYATVAAVMGGGCFGDHCSPISDTTIMSSAGAQSNHLNHVSTQLPYAITVAAISFAMFVLAGFVKNAVICLAIGVVVTVATLFIIRKLAKNVYVAKAAK